MNLDKFAENQLKDFVEGRSWRIKTIDAPIEDKFTADMELIELLDMGSWVQAYGIIYNDSRELFPDGTDISTSAVKSIFTYAGDYFIETRNTVYCVISSPIDMSLDWEAEKINRLHERTV